MKDYFFNLFYYDQYANELIVETINKAGQPEKPVQLMAHLFAAQQIWYNRCCGLPPAAAVLWPDWKADTFARLMSENHANWIAFLNRTPDSDFEKQIKYKNLKGEDFSDTLTDILTHVINHGTHHRAQAGQLLKLAGLDTLPPTDYIFYIRQIK